MAVWWEKPREVTVCVDTPGWFEPYAEQLVRMAQAAGDKVRLVRSPVDVPQGEIAFYLSCLRLTEPEVLGRNRHNIVVHASALPQGRGFSPAVWQVLEGRTVIPVRMIFAAETADSGDIIMEEQLELRGHELNDEIRIGLGKTIVGMCLAYLSLPAPPSGRPQQGDSSWYPRRRPEDSRLDPERTIAEQFDLLRVVDNDRYAAFFDHRGHRYVLRIERPDHERSSASASAGSQSVDMSPTVSIAGRPIGQDHEPYIICELSGNHNGSLERALALLDAAAGTGADAIKIQSYTPDTITIDHDGPDFQIRGGPWDGRTFYDLYEEAQTPFEWHVPLFARARELGVTLFSSPFDESAVDLLESLGAPAYKIASFEAVDLPLIAYVAKTKKPMIISTGMANIKEIGNAVRTARENGCDELILLHCVSSYPAPDEDSNVRTVPDLGKSFGCVSGLSDHTVGSAVAVASIALGGSVIEKHFTLARSDGGPDAGFSLEPDEFVGLVNDCKRAWRALGKVRYDLQGSERGSVSFRRSLYVVADIPKGEALTHLNIRSIRPGYGLPPCLLPEILGRRAARDLKRGERLSLEVLD